MVKHTILILYLLFLVLYIYYGDQVGHPISTSGLKLVLLPYCHGTKQKRGLMLSLCDHFQRSTPLPEYNDKLFVSASFKFFTILREILTKKKRVWDSLLCV